MKNNTDKTLGELVMENLEIEVTHLEIEFAINAL